MLGLVVSFVFYFAILALPPGLIVASIVCCQRGWSTTNFWSAFARTNMTLAFLPLLGLPFAFTHAQSHGAGALGVIFMAPFVLLGGTVWFFANKMLLKLPKAD